MKILIYSYSTDADAVTCDVALVTVNLPKLLARAKAAKTVADDDLSFADVSYWDQSAVFYEGSIDLESNLPAKLFEQLQRDRFVPVPDCFELDLELFKGVDIGNPMRTDADRLSVTERGEICWSSHVRHCDVRVETYPINIAALA